MTELEKQIDKVNREVDLLMASDETRLAIEEIEWAHESLNSVLVNFDYESTIRQAMLESEEDFNLSDIESIESTIWSHIISSYDLVREVWEDNKTKVRQDAAFQDLVQSLTNLAKSMQQNNKRKWHEWVTAEATSFSVSDAELESIRHVPEYKEDIRRFKAGIADFSQLESRLPNEVDAIVKLKALSNRLREIKSGFNFSLPEYVLRFYRELDENRSFPLNRIDEKLMKWLADNDELKNLAVTRRRSGGF